MVRFLKWGADGYVEFDGEVVCSKGGTTCYAMVECIDIYEKI